RAAGTKTEILQGAIDVNVVADIGLSIEIVGGLGPLDFDFGTAVAKTIRAQICWCARRCVVIWIDWQSDQRDRITEWAGVIAEIDGASGEAISGAGLERTEGGSRNAAAYAKVEDAVQINLGGEMWTVVLRRYPGDVGIVRPDLVNVHDGCGCGW